MRAVLSALLRVIAVALAAMWMSPAAGAETTIPSMPAMWVTDNAAFLSAQTVSDLNVRLREYERHSGHQVLVYVEPTTGGVPIEDWAVRAFAKWKVGRKGLDDGLVLFIFPKDRALRIEVGYGLESKVPDVLASRIIRETISPALQAGQPDRGVTDGVNRILQLTGADERDAATPVLTPPDIAFIVLVLLVFGIVAIRSPWLALYLLVNIFGGRGGGGGGGEVGFSGGGGRSGGGGASGRW